MYDVIVIGGGSGLSISSAAAAKGMKVALVEEGPLGGTCLNRGCIPSKMLIHPADVVETIKNAGKYGIKAKYSGIDFSKLVKYVSATVDKDAKKIEKGNRSNKNIDLYKTRGVFVGKKKVKVGKKIIEGKKIVIAAGTRPLIPNISGLDKVNYMTSKEALRITKQPKSIICLGGGYITTELGHFLGALGTKVTIIQSRDALVRREDKDISKAFTKEFSKNHNVILGHRAIKVEKKGRKIVVTSQDKKGKKKKVSADELLVAVGRISNTDRLNLKKTGVKVNKHGYVVTNKYMETNVKGIYALGDIAGKYFFKHSANLEAQYVWWNMNGNDIEVDYSAMPHAIFSSPQIAGVGYTEQELIEKKIKYKKTMMYYKDVAMGMAFKDETSFIKAFASEDGKILGCHIMGPEASTLIHEVIVIMRMNGDVKDITKAIHIHPALSELIQRSFLRLR